MASTVILKCVGASVFETAVVVVVGKSLRKAVVVAVGEAVGKAVVVAVGEESARGAAKAKVALAGEAALSHRGRQ